MKGVPPRIEIEPRDLEKKKVRFARRDNSEIVDIPLENLVQQVEETLNKVQENLFLVAKQKRDASIKVAKTWEEFMEALSQKKMILPPWCDEMEVEEDVKNRTKGEIGATKSLCTPFEQPELPEGTLCFASGKPAKKWTDWAGVTTRRTSPIHAVYYYHVKYPGIIFTKGFLGFYNWTYIEYTSDSRLILKCMNPRCM